MGKPKRNETQREYDLERTAAAYLRGKRQVDIAEELGVSQQQVSYDIKVLHRRWRESALIDLNEAKQRELARIDTLELEYWQAWEASRGERQRSAVSKTGETSRAQIVKYDSPGDPRFLAGVQWCVEQRCKILGILAAVRNELSGPDGGPVTIRLTWGDNGDGDNAATAAAA